jgi:dTDP-4-dehydrorhamnose reductase
MTRWLLTGARGMLATDVLAVLRGRDHVEVDARSRESLDVTDPDACRDAVREHDVVVNCAAYTAVDLAETNEGDAFAVNAVGAANLARAAAAVGASMVHVSTDYVFSGAETDGYSEQHPPDPRCAYGRTKAAGEWAVRAELPQRHWILRTAWLYGQGGPSFASTMIRLERERPTVQVVDDQRGQPTWSRDVAERIVAVATAAVAPGTYHATNAGGVTWFEFARAIFERLGADPARVEPTTSAQFVRPAPRPANSVLTHDGWAGTGLPALRPWREALDAAFRVGAFGD